VRPGLAAFCAAVFAIVSAGPSLAVGPGGVRLQPHVAVYDLALHRTEDRLGLASVNGRLAIEVSGSECEDWTVNFRMVSQFLSDDQTSRVLDTQSSTWEAGDGKSINVSQRHFVDSSLDSESKITASQDADGRTHGVIDKPKQQEFELANGTIFPVMHLQRLMEAGKRGELRDKSSVFDGTEGSKAYTAITLIGRPRDKKAHKTELKSNGGELLAKVKAWPATISYYDQARGENNDGLPAYEVSVEMFENGVSGDMIIDYGDYALDAKLAKLQLKAYGECK
jgi:hypothetical protein